MKVHGNRLFLLLACLSSLAVAAAGCAGSDTPTSPQQMGQVTPTAALVLSNATVSVGGQAVNGQTIQHGHVQGTHTFFQAMLHDGDHPALGQTVQVKYQWPGGMGMMHHQGIVTLYDDGTHGDWQSGDGIYCFEDRENVVGFCGQGAPFGTYHYEFWGEHHSGRHSNHVDVSVTITNQ